MSPRNDSRLPLARLLSGRGERRRAHARQIGHRCRSWVQDLRLRSIQRREYGSSAVMDLFSVLRLMWPIVLFSIVMLWVAGFSGSP